MSSVNVFNVKFLVCETCCVAKGLKREKFKAKGDVCVLLLNIPLCNISNNKNICVVGAKPSGGKPCE